MPGQKSRILEWPYTEALRIDEAVNPLTLLAVGLYGRVLPPQNGAPLRVITPWKYGFKGAKSIVRMRFVEEQPRTTWAVMAPTEYGFYGNVNPAVDHRAEPGEGAAPGRVLPARHAAVQRIRGRGGGALRRPRKLY